MNRLALALAIVLVAAPGVAFAGGGVQETTSQPFDRRTPQPVASSPPSRALLGLDDWHPGDVPLTLIDERRGELLEIRETPARFYEPGSLVVRGQTPADYPPTMHEGGDAPAGDLIPAEAFFGDLSDETLISSDADLGWDAPPYRPDALFAGDERHVVRRTSADDVWRFVLLPEDLIYRSYLAGAKESRFGTQIVWDNDDLNPNTYLWEATLGARVGLLRFGSVDGLYPQGFQLDAEGSAQVRLDIMEDVDVRSVDFRGGVPLTYGFGKWQAKLAYYHLSSHLGDEFLIKNPTYDRLNFARDVFVLGLAYNVTDDLRVYGEVGYAFYDIVSEPWETQFGVDFAPARPTGFAGAPFAAANVHLREELDFSGNFTAQAGWAWRSDRGRKLLRIGATYYNGLSSQNSFYQRHEQQIGIGAFYDF